MKAPGFRRVEESQNITNFPDSSSKNQYLQAVAISQLVQYSWDQSALPTISSF